MGYAAWTLAAAGIAICLVTCLLVVDLTSTVLICVCVFTIMAGLVGYGYPVMGLEFTSSWVTSLIMCIGFSVDYCAHVVVAYLSYGKEETGREPDATECPKNTTSRDKLVYTLQVNYTFFNIKMLPKFLSSRITSCLQQRDEPVLKGTPGYRIMLGLISRH